MTSQHTEFLSSLVKASESAVLIYGGGACNPRAVARELVNLIDFACETKNSSDIRQHPAAAPARLVLSQLSFLLGTGIGEYDGVEQDFEDTQRRASVA